ncbi:MAG TPA: pectinesterase family protein [Pyrinomonadaceae bacterium]|nr:pectinesterase family protein [Pyrinomonadaceae bacterium]
MMKLRATLNAAASLALLLIFGSAASAQTLFPAKDARDVNPDAQLKLTFSGPPRIGPTGRVRVFEATTDRLVDTLDLSVPAGPTERATGGALTAPYLSEPYNYDRNVVRTNGNTIPGTPSAGAVPTQHTYQLTIIGGFTDGFHFYPIIVSGNTATIQLHHNLLEYGKSYYVLIDPEVLTMPDGSFKGITDEHAWRFSTKAKPPRADAETLTVSADGTGDFNTVQGAIDFVPDHGKKRVTIRVRKGIYQEIVYFRNKDNVSFIGEDRDATVVRYANNEVFNPHPVNIRTNELPGTFPSRRAAFAADNSNEIHLINMTLETTAPGQAEGLLMTGRRNILKNVRVIGFGDALQVNGPTYIVDSLIEGAGDTILGRGPAFFERTTLKSRSIFMWIRNTATNHGNVFKDCRFIGTGQPTTLARSPKNGASTYPYAEAVLLNAKLSGIAPEGWGAADEGGKVHFWEYNSRNFDGSLIDVSKRSPLSRQLDRIKDAKLISDYSNPAFVLDGWTPQPERAFSR